MVLRGQERIVLRLVIVRIRRCSTLDVVWNLKRLIRVRGRDFQEIPTARERVAYEFIRIAACVVHGDEVWRIEKPIRRLAAPIRDQRPCANRAVPAETRVERTEGTASAIAFK